MSNDELQTNATCTPEVRTFLEVPFVCGFERSPKGTPPIWGGSVNPWNLRRPKDPDSFVFSRKIGAVTQSGCVPFCFVYGQFATIRSAHRWLSPAVRGHLGHPAGLLQGSGRNKTDWKAAQSLCAQARHKECHIEGLMWVWLKIKQEGLRRF